jgi:hypothetical protein
MATSKKSGEFSYTSTSVTFEQLPGGLGVSRINLEGTASGFGTVLATLSMFGDAPGGKTGRTSWVGSAFLDNGDEVQGTAEGFFEETGKHKWRLRGILRTSTGAVFRSEGVLSLAGRSYKGSFSEWS